MTVIKKSYSNEAEYRRDLKPMNLRGFRVLHHDTPFNITWVNGTDNPVHTPALRTLSSTQFLRELATRDDVNIT